MTPRASVVLLAALAFGLLSCSGWCAGCIDTRRVSTFSDGGACFERTDSCSFPAPPHPPAVSIVEVPCDGG